MSFFTGLNKTPVRKLFSFAGIIFLLSCSGLRRSNPDQHIYRVNDNWVAVRIGEKDLSGGIEGDPASLPQLEIKVGEMKYNGSDGCNNYMGGLIELDEKIIRFGIAAGTRMMCHEMEIPDLFNRTLPEVWSWAIKKKQLHLFDKQGSELMQLKKVD